MASAVSAKKIFLQSIMICTGTGLILAYIYFDWGLTALSGGVFFLTVALFTIGIDLAEKPGPFAVMLKSRAAGFFMLAATLILLCATVVIGVLSRIGMVH